MRKLLLLALLLPALALGATKTRYRMIEGAPVNVKDFEAKGDGVADDTVAIRNAIASLSSSSRVVYFPAGFYRITAAIVLPNTPVVRLVGEGKYASRISVAAPAPIGAIFDTNPANTYDTIEIRDLGFLGQGLAGSAFRAENVIHSVFERLMITGTTAAAIRLNNGYSNTVTHCDIISNTGSGLDISGTADSNNNVNILFNHIYNAADANVSGIGVRIGQGMQFNLIGNGIENWGGAGVVAYDLKGLLIQGNYFERNGASGAGATGGLSYTTPHALRVKADIHLYSATTALSYTFPYFPDTVRIVGNQFTPYGTINSGSPSSPASPPVVPIFSMAANRLVVASNQLYNQYVVPYMVGTDLAAGALINYLDVERNSVNTVGDLYAGQPIYLHVSQDRGDASFTLVPGRDATVQRVLAELTANRTITLSSNNALGSGHPASPGDKFRVVKQFGGAQGVGLLDIGPGLYTIAAADQGWVDVEFDGSAWRLTGFGKF